MLTESINPRIWFSDWNCEVTAAVDLNFTTSPTRSPFDDNLDTILPRVSLCQGRYAMLRIVCYNHTRRVSQSVSFSRSPTSETCVLTPTNKSSDSAKARARWEMTWNNCCNVIAWLRCTPAQAKKQWSRVRQTEWHKRKMHHLQSSHTPREYSCRLAPFKCHESLAQRYAHIYLIGLWLAYKCHRINTCEIRRVNPCESKKEMLQQMSNIHQREYQKESNILFHI